MAAHREWGRKLAMKTSKRCGAILDGDRRHPAIGSCDLPQMPITEHR
jgi:hypothetical protein